ncbi:hypothetical protein SAMN02910298_01013 [Pseudobutyrivibrio sp. YE44]|uniref:hypothetical protein n=1 Tax=Pseudobutyrivibrio sp. YE44 TaxID=1520802 RepID=UPI00088E4497|nr:hypothetical protein [Pseudobutyrivibrio sp. YE44]SDB21291.1 hypothetical protein SAMN02910298_01013 [Pseudobutyrivibrio sp. YE44]
MPPSHHSSSSHSSYSGSHSSFSGSHSSSSHSSHSWSSSSSHSGSSHSGSSSSGDYFSILSLFDNDSSSSSSSSYRTRNNQPRHYSGSTPRIYRCENHDYIHYNEPWTDEETGKKYKAGYYDEDGVFYEDIVFSQYGKILATTTAVCKCDYCGMDDSRSWADREKPCKQCGGTMSLVSQVDELKDEEPEESNYRYNDNDDNYDYHKPYTEEDAEVDGVKAMFVAITIIVAIAGMAITSAGTRNSSYDNNYNYDYLTRYKEDPEYRELIDTQTKMFLTPSNNETDTNEYNIPDLGTTMFLKEEDGSFVLTDESDYSDNFENSGYKSLPADADGNYYDKDTDMYVWLNEDIDPPQFQYWLEGLSSQYGDYGWMEYDSYENRWYIETEEDNWLPIDDDTYEEYKDRLWHIDYDFNN